MVEHEVGVRSHALALGVFFALVGCAVGPNFHAPAPPAVDTYRKDALLQTTAAANAPTGDAQRFLENAAVPTRWWTTFASDELDRRVEQALTHSPSITSAQAVLRQAQENAIATRGSLFPTVDVKAGAERGNANGFGFSTPGVGAVPGAVPTTFTLYNVGVSVGYTLDVFGGVRRSVEAQSALTDFQRFQLEGTYLSLAANVATTSFQEASLREQIRATEEIMGIYRKELDLVQRQNEIGAKSLADVLVIATQVATSQATLPPLRRALEQTQTQLAVYMGQFPSAADLAAVDLDTLTLPLDVPVSVPSMLTRQRPDIRAAEAQLHQSTAAVGVATANLFPQITLSGGLGSSALRAQDLFTGGTEAWTLGANLLQPVFRGGALRAQKRAAEASLDKAAADYKNAVLNAFQNVADSLRALELDAESLQAQAQAKQSAARSLDLVREQYRNGTASYLQVLDATRQYQQAHIGLIQARAARLGDTAALYTALGGGWREGAAPEVPATAITSQP